MFRQGPEEKQRQFFIILFGPGRRPGPHWHNRQQKGWQCGEEKPVEAVDPGVFPVA
jgi:hypothetical protein